MRPGSSLAMSATSPRSPWYYEIQELTKIVQSNDYERCYQLLENTEIVVDILEKARKSAHLSF